MSRLMATPVSEMSDRELKSRIAFLNENGKYADEVRDAKAELTRRGVDFSDCLEPRS